MSYTFELEFYNPEDCDDREKWVYMFNTKTRDSGEWLSPQSVIKKLKDMNFPKHLCPECIKSYW